MTLLFDSKTRIYEVPEPATGPKTLMRGILGSVTPLPSRYSGPLRGDEYRVVYNDRNRSISTERLVRDSMGSPYWKGCDQTEHTSVLEEAVLTTVERPAAKPERLDAAGMLLKAADKFNAIVLNKPTQARYVVLAPESNVPVFVLPEGSRIVMEKPSSFKSEDESDEVLVEEAPIQSKSPPYEEVPATSLTDDRFRKLSPTQKKIYNYIYWTKVKSGFRPRTNSVARACGIPLGSMGGHMKRIALRLGVPYASLRRGSGAAQLPAPPTEPPFTPPVPGEQVVAAKPAPRPLPAPGDPLAPNKFFEARDSGPADLEITVPRTLRPLGKNVCDTYVKMRTVVASHNGVKLRLVDLASEIGMPLGTLQNHARLISAVLRCKPHQWSRG